jgi:hypothetical protein
MHRRKPSEIAHELEFERGAHPHIGRVAEHMLRGLPAEGEGFDRPRLDAQFELEPALVVGGADSNSIGIDLDAGDACRFAAARCRHRSTPAAVEHDMHPALAAFGVHPGSHDVRANHRSRTRCRSCSTPRLSRHRRRGTRDPWTRADRALESEACLHRGPSDLRRGATAKRGVLHEELEFAERSPAFPLRAACAVLRTRVQDRAAAVARHLDHDRARARNALERRCDSTRRALERANWKGQSLAATRFDRELIESRIQASE